MVRRILQSRQSIQLYKAVGVVLDNGISSFAENNSMPVEDVYLKVEEFLQEISSQYNSGNAPQIPFDEYLCKLAYLYYTVPVNGLLTKTIFEKDSNLQKFVISKQTLRVLSLGGGPGSEILGLAKFLESSKHSKIALHADVTDKIATWSDCWNPLLQEVEFQLSKKYGANRQAWPLEITSTFSHLDVKSTAGIATIQGLSNVDLCIVSYMMSDIFSNFASVKSCVLAAVQHLPVGSKFLFIDRNGPSWVDAITETAQHAGLTLSIFEETEAKIGQFRDEAVSDLGGLWNFLHDRHLPRMSWKAIWVVGTKEN